ncbi:TAXI family TRAP transporter solute-binding subunit [Clostridium sp.]|uniref:TAXI family TRAP transporter solute-binding subunit n=1 Tax=Clostridium sp. TaxID=1506 RepID=UPI001A547B65|nr:TAXI family TRAP transporter solute-binding subunit [Clostridium sp.]MBK5236588.1 TAXI family TRAP transporter solute-binding subunit [Clostridium sp.]
MKRNVKVLIAAVLAMGVLAGCSSKPADPAATPDTKKAEKQFVNIGTGGTAGTYFPLGGAFAEIWNSSIDGINATSQSTGASVANINLLKDKKIEVAIVQNDVAWYTEQGKEMFKDGKYADIRGLVTLYSEPLQIITTDPSIKTIADLKGKRIAVGAIGSGVEANARQIIAAAGLDFEKDIQAKFLSFSEASAGLKDKQVDVAFLTAGIPTAALQDLGAQNDITVIPVDGAIAEKLMKDYKFFTEFTIPANTYNGQTEDVQTLTVRAMLVVNADLDEDLAYNMVKAIYDNQDRIVAAHNVGKKITKETALGGMSVTLHPGAAKYFKEEGITE